MKNISTNKIILSEEQAKKINQLLNLGYSLITVQELEKKKKKNKNKSVQKLTRIKKKQKEVQYIPLIVSTKKNINHITTNHVKIQESVGRRNHMVNTTQGITTEIISSKIILEKLKQHKCINLLTHVPKKKFESSFKDIQDKINMMGQDYNINDLVNQISNLCLRVYQNYSSITDEYKDAASIESYLNKLVKQQKQNKKIQILKNKSIINSSKNSNNNNSIASINFYQNNNIPKITRKKTLQKSKDMITNKNNVITLTQKRILGQNIKKLPSEYLQEVCLIVFENLQNRQYTFDIDTLHVKKIRQLQEYVRSCMDKIEGWAGGTAGGGDQQRNLDRSQEENSNESSFIITDDYDDNVQVKDHKLII